MTCLWLLIALSFCTEAQTLQAHLPQEMPDVGNCNCSQLGRDRRQNPINLGSHKWQNFIRDNFKLTNPFEKKLVENFFWRCGNYKCTEAEFFEIANYAAFQWTKLQDSVVFTRNGQTFTAKQINFYGSETLDCALGSAWFVIDNNKTAVGFYDYYNFNKASFFGKHRRPMIHEVATRFIRLFKKQTQDFIVYYGIVPDTIANQLVKDNQADVGNSNSSPL
jgi:hypothetical protein